MNAVGKVPEVIEALITCVIAAVTVGAMDCRRLDGIGSSGHVVGRLHVRSLDTSLSVRGVNEVNDAVGLLHVEEVWFGLTTSFTIGSVNWLLMAATLSTKNEANVSAVRFVAGGGGGGLSRVLKSENSFLVSVALWILSL